MIDIEIISVYLGQILSIVVSLWILIKHDRRAGSLLLFSFIVMSTQFVVMTSFSDVVSFEHIVEDGVYIDLEMTAPIWYEILMVIRSFSAITLPLGIYFLVRSEK